MRQKSQLYFSKTFLKLQIVHQTIKYKQRKCRMSISFRTTISLKYRISISITIPSEVLVKIQLLSVIHIK